MWRHHAYNKNTTFVSPPHVKRINYCRRHWLVEVWPSVVGVGYSKRQVAYYASLAVTVWFSYSFVLLFDLCIVKLWYASLFSGCCESCGVLAVPGGRICNYSVQDWATTVIVTPKHMHAGQHMNSLVWHYASMAIDNALFDFSWL